MKKSDWIISIIAGVILGIFAVAFGVTKGIIIPHTVKAESNADEVVGLMLKSHTAWKTLKGTATIVWVNPKDGSQQTYTNFVEITNPSMAKVEISDNTGKDILDWYANGSSIVEVNSNSKSYQEYNQKDFSEELSMIPSEIGNVDEQTIYRHPMATIMPSPVVDYIYSTGLAQRQGTYAISGEDEILGRNVWILDFSKQDESNQVTMQARYWVDKSTGVILQANVFSTDPKTFGALIESDSFTEIEFDQPIQESDFTPSLSGFEKESTESLPTQP